MNMDFQNITTLEFICYAGILASIAVLIGFARKSLHDNNDEQD